MANWFNRGPVKANYVYQNIHLQPADNQRLANLCGPLDSHLQQLEQHFDVAISHRGTHFQVKGMQQSIVDAASTVLLSLYEETQQGTLSAEFIHLILQETMSAQQPLLNQNVIYSTKLNAIKTRSANQAAYIKHMAKFAINFGIGPAGTGKTYLAVACAVAALEAEHVRRILLVRPMVEAGEKLGFLPGDIAQKVDPYFRPLYDALFEILGFDRATKLIERQVIEIAPLAYMRGRTLNESFIILDESQNTSREQMKMFLTRIGFGSTAVITGDLTQIDLPRGQPSGLHQAVEVLQGVNGIGFTFFTAKDVVRHPLVQAIINAYDQHQGGEIPVAK